MKTLWKISISLVFVLALCLIFAGGYITGVRSLPTLGIFPSEPGTPADSMIDPRSYWITVSRTASPAGWALTNYTYQDELQSGGNHNIYVTALDENGAPLSGITVWQKWPDAGPNEVQQTTLGGVTNFGVWGGPFYPDQGQTGAYWVYVESEAKSDVVRGMGLPVNRHVNYILTFQRRKAIPTPTIESVTPTPTHTPVITPTPGATPTPGKYITPPDLANWLRQWAHELDGR